MLTKKLAVLITLTVMVLLCPAAHADGDRPDGSASAPPTVQASGTEQKDAATGINPAAFERASRSLFQPVGTSRSVSTLSSSAGSAAAASTGSTDDEWEFIVAPYIMFASLDGNMGVGRATSLPLNVSAGSILENFQFGFMGRFEVRKGAWGGIFEASYVQLGASVPMAGAIVGTERVTDAEFEQTMLEGFLSYRTYQSDKTSLDLFGGVRYWDMDLDLAITGPLLSESFSGGERWADPVVGVRVIHFLSDKWFVPVRGDIGGFGRVGATSAFTWNVQGGVGYQFNKHVAFWIQYKALGDDFDNGKQGTRDFFAYDAIQHGPLLGFALKF